MTVIVEGGSKVCFKCLQIKPLSEYYRHSEMADGHLNKCKDCAKKDVSARYRETIEQRREYERKRNKDPARRAAAMVYARKRNASHPDKYFARTAVHNAVRDGRLIKEACKLCGATERVQAHHEDYSRPLDIEWLCFRCHRGHRHGQITAP